MPLNSPVKGRVIILSSNFADDVAYPTDCEGTGVRLAVPSDYDIEKHSNGKENNSLMGGKFYTANIAGITSKELRNGRPDIIVEEITDVKPAKVPEWFNAIE